LVNVPVALVIVRRIITGTKGIFINRAKINTGADFFCLLKIGLVVVERLLQARKVSVLVEQRSLRVS
jgi:hypothetical protein